jgi:hypothetical protein
MGVESVDEKGRLMRYVHDAAITSVAGRGRTKSNS